MKPAGSWRVRFAATAAATSSQVAGAHRVLADDRRRRLLAAADAGRGDDADAGAEQRRQPLQQLLRTGHLARQAVADANGERRRRRLAFPDDVEVVIEARDLEHLGLREIHLGGERREVRRAEAPVAVLDLVQVLDQQVAPPRRVAEQRTHLGERRRIDAPAARRFALALAARPFGSDRDDGAVHGRRGPGLRVAARASPRRVPIGTSHRAPRPGSRSSTRTPECRARTGTAPLPRPRRRRPATPRSA